MAAPQPLEPPGLPEGQLEGPVSHRLSHSGGSQENRKPAVGKTKRRVAPRPQETLPTTVRPRKQFPPINQDLFAIWNTSTRPRTPVTKAAHEHAVAAKALRDEMTAGIRQPYSSASHQASVKLSLGAAQGRRPRSPGAIDGIWISRLDGEVRGQISGGTLQWPDGDTSSLQWHGENAISIVVDGDTHTGIVTDGRIKWADGDTWFHINADGGESLESPSVVSPRSGNQDCDVEFRNWQRCAWSPRAAGPRRRQMKGIDSFGFGGAGNRECYI